MKDADRSRRISRFLLSKECLQHKRFFLPMCSILSELWEEKCPPIKPAVTEDGTQFCVPLVPVLVNHHVPGDNMPSEQAMRGNCRFGNSLSVHLPIFGG